MKNRKTVKELTEIYNNNTFAEACKLLDISPPTFSNLLKENNIERKGAGRPKKITIIKD